MDIGIILASKPRNGLSGAASCAILSHKEARKIRSQFLLIHRWLAAEKGQCRGNRTEAVLCQMFTPVESWRMPCGPYALLLAAGHVTGPM